MAPSKKATKPAAAAPPPVKKEKEDAAAAPPPKKEKGAKPEPAAAAATEHDKATSEAAQISANRDMDRRLEVLNGIIKDELDEVKRALAMVSYKRLVETMRRAGIKMTGRKAKDYKRVYDAYVSLTGAPRDAAALADMKCDELRCIGRVSGLRRFSKALKADLVSMIVSSRRALEEFVELGGGMTAPEASADDYETQPDGDESESESESDAESAKS
eukprot:jgi/Tetstr1/464042/TSEL_008847.t1